MRKHHRKTYKLGVAFCPLPRKLNHNGAPPTAPTEAPPTAPTEAPPTVPTEAPPRKQARLEQLDNLLDSQSCEFMDSLFSSQVSIPSPSIPSPYPVISTPVNFGSPNSTWSVTPSPNDFMVTPSPKHASSRNESDMDISAPQHVIPDPNDDCPDIIDGVTDSDFDSSDDESSSYHDSSDDDDSTAQHVIPEARPSSSTAQHVISEARPSSSTAQHVIPEARTEYPSPNTYLKKVAAKSVVKVLSRKHAGVVLEAACVKKKMREMRCDYRQCRTVDSAKVTCKP